MSIRGFTELLINIIKTHLTDLSLSEDISVLEYDGRFTDEQLSMNVIAREKVILLEVSQLSFETRPSSEKIYDVVYKMKVNIYVGIATVTDKNKARYNAMDICRKLLQMLYIYPPTNAVTEIQSFYSTYLPSKSGFITKVFDTSSGYSLSKIELEYVLSEKWK